MPTVPESCRWLPLSTTAERQAQQGLRGYVSVVADIYIYRVGAQTRVFESLQNYRQSATTATRWYRGVQTD
ncbi:hypothetical protein SBF1_510006 [Candidatus Desulfosporosinus infrequens]|uniref:Uncharacterized protein n=1 Tax=Candidatus Desulfosporosinus infrequens TaxID=2043169 RepID=A0A2U3LI33_9FIRM|nr:hypothetical protein SBF1_510006 [Candidatus Desulfosporosinus infrequens]